MNDREVPGLATSLSNPQSLSAGRPHRVMQRGAFPCANVFPRCRATDRTRPTPSRRAWIGLPKGENFRSRHVVTEARCSPQHALKDGSMRITCTATDRGNVYQFSRSNDDFRRDLRAFVPLLLAADCDVVIGDEHDPPGAPILTVGPLDDESEKELRRRAQRYLVPDCPPGPPPPQILANRRQQHPSSSRPVG